MLQVSLGRTLIWPLAWTLLLIIAGSEARGDREGTHTRIASAARLGVLEFERPAAPRPDAHQEPEKDRRSALDPRNEFPDDPAFAFANPFGPLREDG